MILLLQWKPELEVEVEDNSQSDRLVSPGAVCMNNVITVCKQKLAVKIWMTNVQKELIK